MNVEPQSKAEARVLKRVRLSEHWTARVMAPIALVVVPLIDIICGLYLWRIGDAKADAYVVCLNTGNELIPCPDIPPLSRICCVSFLIVGFVSLVWAWTVMLVLRERRIVKGLLTRLTDEKGNSEPVAPP